MIFHIAMILTIIGALNWGIVGVTSLFGNKFNVVEWISFDVINQPIVGDMLYVIIGAAAVTVLVLVRRRLA